MLLEMMGVKHAITGAFAAARYGVIRATMDVDILLHVKKGKWEEIVKSFLENGFIFRGEDFHKLGIATLKTPECFGVDLILEDDPDVFKRVKRVDYYGTIVAVVTLEDLIRTKLRFRREKDILDLRILLEANAGKIDWKYLERKITDPDEKDLLKRLRRRKEIPLSKLKKIPVREFCPKESP
jgi:hypothetical protein